MVKRQPLRVDPNRTADRLTEVRHGGRNFLRTGDYCWVKHEKPGRRGFPARFQYAIEEPSGLVYCVHELADGGRYRMVRNVPAERVERRKKDPYR